MTETVTLRPATLADGEMIWHWRNAPDVRHASLNSDEIALASHLEWFRAALGDANRTILIAMSGDTPVGMVRLDQDGDIATVNILIDAVHRGTGVAKVALAQALDRQVARRYRAQVKADNAASLALFRALGFRVVEDGDPVVLER
ncbi:MAG: GNAT family N-acetyltransferase [Silicimonas sp.]|nr:GNAT family N-acetyltransferase [Silicimonas sp.]